MTVWTPEWSLTVDGSADYANLTLANVTVTSGRTDIYSQATAGYASFTILNFDDTSVDLDINQQVSIRVKNSAGSWVNLFGGYVTDIDIEVEQSGTGGLIQNMRVIALGALSKLPKTLTNGVLTTNYDGVQIYDVLAPILYDQWNEVAPALDWNAYNPTTNWTNANNSGLGEIDTGNYELSNRASQKTDVYSLIAALANSGLGYLYEDNQGRICYADSTHRNTYLTDYGYTSVTGFNANARGIKTSKKSGDIRNSVTITYESGTKSASSAESITTYGYQAQDIQTTLKHAADAQSQADFYLKIRAFPQAQFRTITFPLGNPELDDSDRDSLLNVFMGLALEITDLPSNISDGRFQGFVEGWTFNASYNGLALTLTVSPTAYSLQAIPWNGVSGTKRWNSVSGTLDWNEAIVVA